jgi:hypothetical protein
MAMKIFYVFLLTLLLFSCVNKKGIPDVSGIRVELKTERFERDFFSIDSNDIASGLKKVQQAYPAFYFDFMNEVLGVSGADTSQSTLEITRIFLRDYLFLFDSLQIKFKNIDWLKKDLEIWLKYVKYYFPAYTADKLITFIGPFDAPGTALIENGFAIGLQQYAGKDFTLYQNSRFQEMFPLYISRRFDPKYIAVNCIKLVVTDLFPDKSMGRPLVEQMIEKGKQWWLLDKFLPHSADSLKTGYTQQQLNWCRENEGLIWSVFIRNESLNSIDPVTIQTYIGEGPFTQGFSQENSPGNLGQWVGWQIVKKFAAKNPGLHPGEIMQTDARQILDEARYKPK